MFNLGGMEILVILVVALLVLGPDKLPGFMRAAGRALGELRRASTDVRETVNSAIADQVAASATAPRGKEEPEHFPGKAPAPKTAGIPSPRREAARAEPAGPYTNVPEAPALPPQKRPLPRARRSRPSVRTHSPDDAGDA